jgi:hypothetical protein
VNSQGELVHPFAVQTRLCLKEIESYNSARKRKGCLFFIEPSRETKEEPWGGKDLLVKNVRKNKGRSFSHD